MNTEHQLDNDRWETMLNQLTEHHAGEQITIEVLDSVFGDQVQAERLPFTYASYDRRDDVIVIAVGGKDPRYPVVLRHMINKPVTLSIDHSGDHPAVMIIDADGTTTLVQFFGEP
jgi:uncharacterized protein DUF5335